MMTIVTHVVLKEGSEPEWDAAMRARLAAVKGRPGWIYTQLLIPSDALNKRVLIGTWRTRADWEAWHKDPAFAQTRTRLDGLEAAPRQEWWYEVMLDVRASEMDGFRSAVDTARERLASALNATADWLRPTGQRPG
jgi:heme-degrading monooxygenase HmoA